MMFRLPNSQKRQGQGQGQGPGPGPGPGQGDFEENTRGTEKSVANEGHQSLFIAWERGGGVGRSRRTLGGTQGEQRSL